MTGERPEPPRTLTRRESGYYRLLSLDVLWTGDLVTPTEDIQAPFKVWTRDVPPPDGSSEATPDLTPTDIRRGFERYDLSQSHVTATVKGPPGASTMVGRVRDASVSGMWVECEHPLPFRTPLWVDWCVMGSYSQRFPGRVVRSAGDGMAIILEVDDASWSFRSSFIDLARTPTDDPPSVIISRRREGPADKERSATQDLLMSDLTTRWQALEGSLDDEEAHQAFIHECMKAKHLEFALERYRELRSAQPDSDQVAKYLQHIGTVLTFYTFQPSEDRATSGSKKRFFTYLALLLLAALATLAIVGRMSDKERDGPDELRVDDRGRMVVPN